MKKLLYAVVAMSLLHSCVKDDSSEIFPNENPNFSHITISSDTETLSVDLGQEFVFEPKIEQTNSEKELQYTWTANTYNPSNEDAALGEQIFLQEGMPLNYTFLKLGDYKIRLEVKNEDYSEFKVWKIAVRAYDKGYFVVGVDDAGNSNIAFGRSLSESDIQQGKKLTFAPNLIGEINEGIDLKNFVHISKSITTYGKSEAYLHIFTKDKIHAADPNTFKIFFTANMASQYPDEFIEKVSINDTEGGTATLFTSKGRFLAYKKAELGLFQQSTYNGYNFDEAYTNLMYTAWKNMYKGEAGVDETNSKIWIYVPYAGDGMINNTSGGSKDGYLDNFRPNTYEGYNIINMMRMNGDQWMGNSINYFAIAQKKDDPNTMKLVQFKTSYATAFTEVSVEAYTSPTPITFRKGIQVVPNARYNSAYYADGNKLYVWYPANTSPNNRLPVNHTVEVEAGKEITTMAISYDMKQLYVGVYDKNSTNPLKGSFYIYDTKDIGIVPNLQPVEKYENITTRPVQILYKSNVQDMYYSDDAQFDE